MELTEERMIQNTERYISLLRKVNRPGANVEALISKLLSSDFFKAPASTKFHLCVEGGLCAHSLNVYDNLVMLVEQKGLQHEILEESIIICALLHDLSKMNLYEKAARNVKVYSEQGKKSDELGRFDWKSEWGYAKVPLEERFIFGNHEETSEFLVRQYIPLSFIESSAILNHHGGMGYDSVKDGATYALGAYKLAALLHIADCLASFVDESNE